jgi:hypothetical protein|tara:strand:+ start:181 stop:567 length:387 start_codon:yes stop_codon:yes gene_type:complete
MPIYVYKHPEEEEYREILQGMNDEHSYEEGGVEWQRVFLPPNAAIDSSIDPFSNQQFIDVTANKKGTYGNILDYSKEQSHKRAEKNGGVDPIREKYFKKYAAERRGQRHPKDIREKGYQNKNIKVDYD